HPSGNLSSRGKTQLREDVLDVALRSAKRDHQSRCDLLVRHPVGDEIGDLPLAPRQFGSCAPRLGRGRGYSLLECIGKRLIHGEVTSTGKRSVECMIPQYLPGLLLELLAPSHQVLGPEQLR